MLKFPEEVIAMAEKGEADRAIQKSAEQVNDGSDKPISVQANGREIQWSENDIKRLRQYSD